MEPRLQLSGVVGTGAVVHTLASPMIGPALPPRILSVDSTTLTVGVPGNFAVESTGGPVPSVTEAGALPTGVTFVDNGDGSATLGGTAAAGTAGTYHLTITAANGVSPDATEAFTLTVNQAPSITSATAAPFDVGIPGSFQVTTAGFPTATLTEAGALPAGVTFVDNGDGTATLAGTAAAGTAGTYHLTITAANGVGSGVSQAFALTINPASTAPAITGAGSATFGVGQAGSFVIAATGTPAPAIAEVGSLPAGVTFVDNGNGTATIAGTPSAGTAGVYHLDVLAAPRMIRLQRFGRNRRHTRIVLSFDEAMAPATVQDVNNYIFRPIVLGHVLERPHGWIRVASAAYDPASRTVSLQPAKKLLLHRLYQLTVNGLPPSGLTAASGVSLDGRGNGPPGSDLVVTFGLRASLRGIPVS